MCGPPLHDLELSGLQRRWLAHLVGELPDAPPWALPALLQIAPRLLADALDLDVADLEPPPDPVPEPEPVPVPRPVLRLVPSVLELPEPVAAQEEDTLPPRVDLPPARPSPPPRPERPQERSRAAAEFDWLESHSNFADGFGSCGDLSDAERRLLGG
jgi:hypothetical protein